MPFLSIRTLLRDPKRAFAQVEEAGEPVVVTRHGKPIAALIPVDEARVQGLLLAASPQLAESRQAAANAIAEGRTEPLSNLFERLENSAGANADAASESSEAAEIAEETLPKQELVQLFGAPLAEEMIAKASAEIDELSRSVVEAIADDSKAAPEDLADEIEERAREVTTRIFGRVFGDLVSDIASSVVVTLGEPTPLELPSAERDEGFFARPMAFELLDQSAKRVRVVNDTIVGSMVTKKSGLSIDAYETVVNGIDALQGTKAFVAIHKMDKSTPTNPAKVTLAEYGPLLAEERNRSRKDH